MFGIIGVMEIREMKKMDNEIKNKTIKMTVYMFTNDLPAKKQAWNDGVVHMKANKLHGIRATKSKPLPSAQFKGVENVGNAIKEVIIKNNITLFDEDTKVKRKQVVEYDSLDVMSKVEIRKILDKHFGATSAIKDDLIEKFGC